MSLNKNISSIKNLSYVKDIETCHLSEQHVSLKIKLSSDADTSTAMDQIKSYIGECLTNIQLIETFTEGNIISVNYSKNGKRIVYVIMPIVIILILIIIYITYEVFNKIK